jgi:hypothetical protein
MMPIFEWSGGGGHLILKKTKPGYLGAALILNGGFPGVLSEKRLEFDVIQMRGGVFINE